MTEPTELNATIDEYFSDIGAVPRPTGGVFLQKIILGGALARTARCVLAALLCSLMLVHPAHSQGYAWWADAQTQSGNTITNTICEGVDAQAVAECFVTITGTARFWPWIAPEYGSCGIPGSIVQGGPVQGCYFVEGPSAGEIYGTFEIFAVGAQYWPNLLVPQCEVCSANSVAHPINPAVGNVFTTETDVEFAGSGAVAFRRYYNSADASGIDGVPGWRHSYGRSISTLYQPASAFYRGSNSGLYATPADACTTGFAAIQGSVSAWAGATATYNNGACVVSSGTTLIGTVQIVTSAAPVSTGTTPIEYDVIRDDGQTLRFTLQNGVINNQPGSPVSLAVTGSGFTVTDENDNVEVYNAAGVLQSITNRGGVVQTISYDSNGLFLAAIDSFGNSVTVARNSQGGIASVTTNGGGQVQYAYDGAKRLVTVTNLDGTTRSYTYGNSSFTNALTAEVDESGTQFSTWGYDFLGRATSTQEAGGAGAMTLVYNSNGSVTTTDALGAVRTFNYTRVGDSNLVSGITGSQCPTCQESAATTYDVNGWVASRTDYNGNVTCYANDPTRGLELVRVEGLAPGSTCPTNLAGYTPANGTPERKISTTWNTSFRLPTLVTEAARTTAFGYDSSGNLLTRTITDTTVGPNVSRTWTYTYDAYGHVLSARGPRTDVNSTRTFTYYNCASGAQCGQVQTVTDELGHVTTVNTYNAYGRPLTITDPNGVVTTLTYDTRQRLTSRSKAGETTSFAYYPTGLLHTVTLPDGSTLQYTYDGAHRLTHIADGLGNQIVYTLDALGNQIAESHYDPSNALTLARNQVFNSLSELYRQIGSAGTAAVTTTFSYDSNGNQTSIGAPLGRNTANQYDALNRLLQITDPGNGVTTLNYDSNDDLIAVTDPRSLTTAYAYNGFGDLIQQTSPDTGVTVNSYDSAGNLATAKDARSQTGTYTYDAGNRLTQIAYGDQTITFGYDSGTNGVGRLTSAGDANHTLAWTYDALGRVLGKTQTVGTGSSAVSKSILYSYTNGDLTSLVTPSGQTVTYGYTNGQVTSIVVNGTALLSQVLYEPFGPVSGWTWGNNTNEARVYDQDGNVTSLEAAEGFTYSYDSAFRITGITDSDNSALSQSYGYDALDRLTSATGTNLSESWTYDANGNRQSQGGATSSTYSVAAGSNQLTGISGGLTRTYTYAASGQITSYGGITFSYTDSGRLSSVSTAGSTTNYLFNALGQRVKKSGASVTLFVYDEAGHLLGEYDGSGNLIEETIWMGDIPVATLRPNGTGISVYYVHTDHLNTPRRITSPSNNAIVWRWDSDPFGTAVPNQDPSGSGTAFVYNLRLPGQYADVETGLNYNYHRDYDPGTGRYVESDPLGLAGGSYSTYGYADGDPIANQDPTGQFVFPAPPVPVVGIGTIAAPVAAVAEAGIAGYAFGTGIYDAYGSAIDNGVSGVLGQIDWIYQQAIEYGANHEEVHRICDEPPPPFKDPCEKAKWELKKALSCKAVREAHNTKWFGGVYDQAHADHMQQVDNQIARAIRAVKNSCKPGCGSK